MNNYLKRFEKNLKNNVKRFTLLDVSCRKNNQERNKILIAITIIYANTYKKDKERQKKGIQTDYAKRLGNNVRRLTPSLPSYIETLESIKFALNVRRAIALLAKDAEQRSFRMQNILHFPKEYDLDSQSFLNLLKEYRGPVDDEDAEDTESENEFQPSNMMPSPTDVVENAEGDAGPIINYNEEAYSIKPPRKREKFLITGLGKRTLHGHQTQLKKLKAAVRMWGFPNDLEKVKDTNPYHFKPNEVLTKTIDEFIPAQGTFQVMCFSHSFNPFYRKDIEEKIYFPNQCFMRSIICTNGLAKVFFNIK